MNLNGIFPGEIFISLILFNENKANLNPVWKQHLHFPKNYFPERSLLNIIAVYLLLIYLFAIDYNKNSMKRILT